MSKIDSSPTKDFFIRMLTRDIDLEKSILDLVDNSIDAAIKEKRSFDSVKIEVEFGVNYFSIKDNSGGMSSKVAVEDAFRFGRLSEFVSTGYSGVGRFGVGMKRAIFKIGNHFKLVSKCRGESFSIDADILVWSKESEWSFQLVELKEVNSTQLPEDGVNLTITKLHPNIANQFTLKNFQKRLIYLLGLSLNSFIEQGINLRVNAEKVDGYDISFLCCDNMNPIKAINKIKNLAGV